MHGSATRWFALAAAGFFSLAASSAVAQGPDYYYPSAYLDTGYAAPSGETGMIPAPVDPRYGYLQEDQSPTAPAGDGDSPALNGDAGQEENGIDDRLEALEKAVADLKKPAEEEEKKEEEPEWVDVTKEKWTYDLGGRAHMDYWTWADQDAESLDAYGPLQNYFEMRRLRLEVEGEGYGVYEYKLEVEFEQEPGYVTMRDVYGGIKHVPLIGTARFGNFKEPFSMEELISDNEITFIERGLPNIFSPSRHVGAAAYNYSDDEVLGWSYGVFFEDISQVAKERIDDNQGIDLASRVWASPIYTAEGRGVVHVGAGYVFTDDRDDSVEFASRPETHEESFFVSTGDFAADVYHRANLELAAVYGPLSFQSEFFGVQTSGIDGTDDFTFHGAYAYFSYFLTGEHRAYSRTSGILRNPAPHTNFWVVRTCDGPCAGWGAWEVAGRWSYVDLDDDGVPGDVAYVGGPNIRGKLTDVTLGVNWYWNQNMRWMVNYIHAWGDLPDVGVTNTDAVGTAFHFFF